MKNAAHWTRIGMRTVALFWRNHRCEAHIRTAIWWRDLPENYGKKTQALGAGNSHPNVADTGEPVCSLQGKQ
jgi:kynureninase